MGFVAFFLYKSVVHKKAGNSFRNLPLLFYLVFVIGSCVFPEIVEILGVMVHVKIK